MSETDSSVVSSIDTKRLIESLDYEELFEGTALEGVESEDGSIVEAIGRRLGEVIGRTVGEIVGSKLGAILLPAIVGSSSEGGEESEEREPDESEGETTDGDDDQDPGGDE